MKKKIKRIVEQEEWCTYWDIQYSCGRYYPHVRWEYYTGKEDYKGKGETDYYYDKVDEGFKTYQEAFDFVADTIGEENI